MRNRHPEIQEMEVQYLLENLEKEKVISQLPLWITFLSEGRLPSEAPRAVSSLIGKLVAKSGAVEVAPKPKCPSCNRTTIHYCKHCKSSV